ncbi:MAG: glycosyltransferase family 2 protein [Bacteroidetes bacterium]|nr:glycosyltransferase family 2 protein [Bacteroidota bacterium]
MIEPKVSILILNYNRAYDTIECIDSLTKITYSNYNILIVDNASTDSSYDILTKQYPELEIINSGGNLGYTGGINFGLKILLQRDCDFILIINNDTLVDKQFLSFMIEEMLKMQDAVAAGASILCEHNRDEIWYAGGEIINWRGLAVHSNKGKSFSEIKQKLKTCEVSFITGCLILIRKKQLPEIGIEDERFFMYLDDIELSIRIGKNGFKLLYVPDAKIYHKVVGEKESAFKLYYSVRNRLLLIKESFNFPYSIIAYGYFVLVIFLKIIYWRFFNYKFYKAAIRGLKDYSLKNFGIGNGHNFYN